MAGSLASQEVLYLVPYLVDSFLGLSIGTTGVSAKVRALPETPGGLLSKTNLKQCLDQIMKVLLDCVPKHQIQVAGTQKLFPALAKLAATRAAKDNSKLHFDLYMAEQKSVQDQVGEEVFPFDTVFRRTPWTPPAKGRHSAQRLVFNILSGLQVYVSVPQPLTAAAVMDELRRVQHPFDPRPLLPLELRMQWELPDAVPHGPGDDSDGGRGGQEGSGTDGGGEESNPEEGCVHTDEDAFGAEEEEEDDLSEGAMDVSDTEGPPPSACTPTPAAPRVVRARPVGRGPRDRPADIPRADGMRGRDWDTTLGVFGDILTEIAASGGTEERGEMLKQAKVFAEEAGIVCAGDGSSPARSPLKKSIQKKQIAQIIAVGLTEPNKKRPRRTAASQPDREPGPTDLAVLFAGNPDKKEALQGQRAKLRAKHVRTFAGSTPTRSQTPSPPSPGTPQTPKTPASGSSSLPRGAPPPASGSSRFCELCGRQAEKQNAKFCAGCGAGL